MQTHTHTHTRTHTHSLTHSGIDAGAWVENIEPDHRISLHRADTTDLSKYLPDSSISLVSICLVLHELPPEAARAMFKEAYRVLQPGGCLALMEMDPDAPGYKKLRANPWLFSVLRSTEPYLDEYFNFAPCMPQVIRISMHISIFSPFFSSILITSLCIF